MRGRGGTMAETLAFVPLALLIPSDALTLWMVRGMPAQRRVTCALYLFSQVVVLAYAVLAGTVYRMGGVYTAVASMGGAVCAVSNPLLFRSLARAERGDLDRMRIRVLESQLVYQQRHLERARRSEAEAMLARRGAALALDAVDQRLEAGDSAGARELLGDISQAVLPKVGLFSDNQAVDALLSAKALECEKDGVTFRASVELPERCGVSDVELCAVLSNAVDNAINACRLVAAGERWVAVEVRPRAGHLIVDIRNSCCPDLPGEHAPRSVGLPEHGWGLGIIRVIAERHSGELVCEQEDGEWLTYVIMGLE